MHMSGSKPPDGSSKLKEQLDEAELRLRKLERWVKLITIIAAAITIVNTCSAIIVAIGQRRLATAQALEQLEKQQISYGFEVTPVLLPNGRQFYLKTKLKNYSVKQLHVFIINLRVWKGTGWQDSYYGENASSHTNDIIVSDSLVAEYPPHISGDKEQDQLRLRKLQTAISIEATEPQAQHSFGPYNIDEKQLRTGIWVEGRAYVSETQFGHCGFDPDEQPSEGDIPSVCEKRTGRCDGSGCINAYSPPEFYVLVRGGTRDNTPTFKMVKPQ
jgi:hypothetical protein